MHTEGPWIASCLDRTGGLKRGDNGIRFWSICNEGQYRGEVCNVHAAEHIGGITIDERDANARLIAAAPDLLEALSTFLIEYVRLVESGDAGFWDAEKEPKVIAARAAIARATGAGA